MKIKVKDNNYELAKDAWMMNKVMESMNNEDAYYGSWLYVWPDGESYDDCMEDFSDEDNYNDLAEAFEEIYREYHDDGLFVKKFEQEDIVDYAHKKDKEFGLDDIKVIYYPYAFSLKDYSSEDSKTVGDSESMIIKFKNGYAVTITDTKGMSNREIYVEAYKAMKAVKNSIKDARYSVTWRSNMLSTSPRSYSTPGIYTAVGSKKNYKETGKVADPELLNREIHKMEIDMNADLRHTDWHETYPREALEKVVSDYQERIDKIREAYLDKKYLKKADELQEKLEQIKKVFKLDVVEEKPVGDEAPFEAPTLVYALNPDPYFSERAIKEASKYMYSPDADQRAGAIQILNNDYPAIKKNLENDIASASEIVKNFNKKDLAKFAGRYKFYVNVYERSSLKQKAAILVNLFKKLLEAFDLNESDVTESEPEGMTDSKRRLLRK